MNALGKILKSRIDNEGPLSLHDYMQIALTHPEYGYYSAQDPFGKTGDFITAPEISQMFGELIGLWAVDVWAKLGAPKKFNLVELGPGNGTLMADALHSAKLAPEFIDAMQLHLVETSTRLKTKQAEKLKKFDAHWHDEMPDLRDAALILIANEFFDALPIHQYMYKSGDWYERLVSCKDNRFDYALSSKPTPVNAEVELVKDGDIFETCPEADNLVGKISNILARAGGAALIIDYGAMTGQIGDSFQAMRRHGFSDPLTAPGEADLTAHVKFGHFVKIAKTANIRIDGPTTQGRFLERLGIEARCHLLVRNASKAQRRKLMADLRRLTSAEEMGTLFKTLALSHNMLAPPEGFGN
ncbi:MAG: SAM-dependent methyltransferase [Sneathiella sp.]|nr:SAM-dependent methyltransferase [Sneathiella sp.]